MVQLLLDLPSVKYQELVARAKTVRPDSKYVFIGECEDIIRSYLSFPDSSIQVD